MFIYFGVRLLGLGCMALIRAYTTRLSLGAPVLAQTAVLIEGGLKLTTRGLLFCRVVGLISGSVALYSRAYMDDEQRPLRFIILVAVFVRSMLILISRDSVRAIILG